MHRKNSASVDGGPSRGSRLHKPGSEDPHRRWRNFCDYFSFVFFSSTSVPHTFLPEGFMLWFLNFAWAPMSPNILGFS